MRANSFLTVRRRAAALAVPSACAQAPVRGVKKPSVAAARKLARGIQQQARLERAAGGAAAAPGASAGGPGAGGGGAEEEGGGWQEVAGLRGGTQEAADLIAALKHQEQADRCAAVRCSRQGRAWSGRG